PVQVAEVDRIVEAELRPKCGLHFGRNVRIGRQLLKEIARGKRQPEEQDRRNAEQARNGDQEATQDILAHWAKSRLCPRDHAPRYQSWRFSVRLAHPEATGCSV